MSQFEVTVLLTLGAGVGLIALLSGLTLAASNHDWDRGATLVCAVGGLLNLSIVLVQYTNTRATGTDAFGQPYTIGPGWQLKVQSDCSRLIIVVALLYICWGLIERRQVAVAPVLAAVLAIDASLSTARFGDRVFTTAAISMVLVLAALALVPSSRRGVALGVGTLGVTLAVTSGLLSLLHYAADVTPCAGLNKCGPLGVIVLGTIGNENGTALPLALSLPFIWLGFRGRSRTVLTVYVALMVWTTGSRTALYAAVAGLVLLVTLRPSFDSPPVTRRKVTASLTACLAGAMAIVIVPLVVHDQRALTGRGHLWDVARTAWSRDRWLGHGTEAWRHLYTQSQAIVANATYSTHNQMLDVGFIAGWLGVGLFLAMIVSLFWRLTPRDLLIRACVVFPAAICGIAERPWSIGSQDWMTFAYLGALAVVGPTDRVFPASPERRGSTVRDKMSASFLAPRRSIAEPTNRGASTSSRVTAI